MADIVKTNLGQIDRKKQLSKLLYKVIEVNIPELRSNGNAICKSKAPGNERGI